MPFPVRFAPASAHVRLSRAEAAAFAAWVGRVQRRGLSGFIGGEANFGAEVFHGSPHAPRWIILALGRGGLAVLDCETLEERRHPSMSAALAAIEACLEPRRALAA